MKPRRQLGDSKPDTRTLHFGVTHATRADEIGATHLTPHEIVRVVHHAHLIGLRVPNAEFHVVERRRGAWWRWIAGHAAKNRQPPGVCKASAARVRFARAERAVLHPLRRTPRLRADRRR